MMRSFLPPKCAYSLTDDGRIVTDGTVRRKITGTTFGAVLGHNPYMSPFEASCHLLGLIEEAGVGDKPAVKTGAMLELPIIRYLDAVYTERFLPDEELNICAPREGEHDAWASDWEDEVFAGHIDGVALDAASKPSILEIKTARDLSSWEQGVPKHYRDQVELYNWFLCQSERAYVGLGVVDEAAYKDPMSWEPGPFTVSLYELHIDLTKTSQNIDYARAWYETTVGQHITPCYNPCNPRDKEVWDYLRSVSASEKDISTMIDELAQVESEIEAHDKLIDDKRKGAEALKKQIKDHLVANGVRQMPSASGTYTVTIREQVRKSYDEDKMRADGIDIEKYRKNTVSNVFSLKEVKQQ